MTMNPRLVEELVASRRNDLERAAHGHRLPPTPAVEPFTAESPRRTRGALARRVGVLLISLGRRLADPDAVPAFGAPHRP